MGEVGPLLECVVSCAWHLGEGAWHLGEGAWHLGEGACCSH
jgi:hypothetical protein